MCIDRGQRVRYSPASEGPPTLETFHPLNCCYPLTFRAEVRVMGPEAPAVAFLAADGASSN